MTIAERMADKVLSVRFEDLPAPAVHWSTLGILDTVAVTVAGAREPAVDILLRTPGVAVAPGRCRVLGTAVVTSALDAALVNGVASHALDYDDVNNNIGGHPSVPLVPPLLALADEHGASGRAIIAAYAAGFELETRLGRAVNFHHYEKGWHPTATLGIFGAVAACAHLLGLDRERTATALAMACSMAAGVKANFGTMTKPLHIGNTVRNGLYACLLAREGFTASPDAFEEKQGFLAVFNGAGTHDIERVFDGWGDPFDVMSDGPGLKQYPCCGSTHAAIDCALEIRRAEALPVDRIARVTMLTNPRRLPHTDNPHPSTGLEGKFSMQYVVARALADGSIGLGDFTEAAVGDARLRPLMARIETGVHPDMGPDTPNQFGAEVTVETVDGRRLSHRIDNRVCRGPADPMTEAELRAKFDDCTVPTLGVEGAGRLWAALVGLERLDDAREIARLASAGRDGARSAAE